jgi:hypothetical protein
MTEEVVLEFPVPGESEPDTKTELNTPAGTAPDGSVQTKQAEPAKTFTQAEVDAMVQKRLLKEERRVHRRVEQQLREQAEAKNRDVEPRRDEFRDDEAYLQAQIEHLAEKKAAQKVAERERAQQHERTQEAFLERAEAVKSRYADFDAVVGNPALPINDGMAEFISDSDAGPDLAYFLGKHPTKAAEIAQMSPIKAARELTRIEAEMAAKPKPRSSNAPAPIVPIGGASGGSKSPAEMSDSEYAKWRRTARK